MTNTSPPTEAATLLRECRTIAVVGLSPKAHRDSHHVALYLQQQGYRIVPVNPLATEILGERCWPSLTEAARHEQIDLVDVFRQSDEVPALADEAIAIGARGLWLQLGVRHDAACERARAAGLAVVQDKCTLVEHQRLGALG
ncbi:MAG: CoA-binding protein [Burkholderiaceae bacterium]|nr:CoA-binding protein [Burkholderiaceae bacterium]